MTELPELRILVVDDDSQGRELILKWPKHPGLTKTPPNTDGRPSAG